MKNNMKKFIIIGAAVVAVIIAVVLVLTLTPKEPEPEPSIEPSPSVSSEPPAPVEPEWEPGSVRVNYAEAIYKTFDHGAQLQVKGQYKDYYIVEGEDCDLLIEKRFVRMSTEEAFVSKTGYAYSGAEVFASVYMREEPIATLSSNTELTVEEGNADWLKVSWADGSGYVFKSDVSDSYISYSGGGGGGGASSAPAQDPSDGTDVPITDLSAGRSFGGLVPLGKYYGPAAETEPAFAPGAGMVVADGVEAYLQLFMRDDEVKVTEYDDEYCTIWIEEEIFVKLPRWLVTLGTDVAYTSWNGFSASGAVVYGEYQLRNEVTTLDRNTEIVVLDELPDKYSYHHEGCYVVTVNGEIGYMLLDEASDTEYSVPSYSGGGGGSSAPAGGGDVWTPPAL